MRERERAADAVGDGEWEGLADGVVLMLLRLTVGTVGVGVEHVPVALWVTDAEPVRRLVSDGEEVAVPVPERDKERPGVAVSVHVPLGVLLRDPLSTGLGVGVAEADGEAVAEAVLRVGVALDVDDHVGVVLGLGLGLTVPLMERVPVPEAEAVRVGRAVAGTETDSVAVGGVRVPERLRVAVTERLAVALCVTVRVKVAERDSEQALVAVHVREHVCVAVGLPLRVRVGPVGVTLGVGLREAEDVGVELDDAEGLRGAEPEAVGGVEVGVAECDEEPRAVGLPLRVGLRVPLRLLLPSGVGVRVADVDRESVTEWLLPVNVPDGLHDGVLLLALPLSLAVDLVRVDVEEKEAVIE